MPYKVTGKIIADDGLPIPDNGVLIKELPQAGSTQSPGGVWADANGNFTLMATSPTSVIEVSCNFFKTRTFIAKDFPSVVQLATEGAVIDAQVTKPKETGSNWLWYAAAAAAVIAVLASGKKKPAKGLKAPAAPKRKILTVTV